MPEPQSFWIKRYSKIGSNRWHYIPAEKAGRMKKMFDGTKAWRTACNRLIMADNKTVTSDGMPGDNICPDCEAIFRKKAGLEPHV